MAHGTHLYKEASSADKNIQREIRRNYKIYRGGVEHCTAILDAPGWYQIFKSAPTIKLRSEFAYGKNMLLSMLKTYANSPNQTCMIALSAAYGNPVFAKLAGANNNNNFQKIRITQKEINGSYFGYIEVYISESVPNNYDVFLHNQTVISENDIIFEAVPFLPAEEGTEVIGTEQEI